MSKRLAAVCARVVLVPAMLLSLVLVGRASGQAAPASAAKEPVFIYLNARLTDHINIEMTEDRIRRLLAEIQRFRKANPDTHISALLLFSGASSDALAQRNGKTHVVDLVKDAVKHGAVEVGYDGSDEPTYKTRPMLDFAAAKSVEDRWRVRTQAAESILTEARNPVTGSPEPGKAGGLKRMQEVFGEAACIRGIAAMVNLAPGVKTGSPLPPVKKPVPNIVPELGGDSETVAVLRHYNTSAMMFGLAEDNPADLPGYGGAVEGFGSVVSPTVESSPEVYWQDNILRTSESSNPSEGAFEAQHDYDALDGLKDDLKELNRSRIHVMHLDLADERYYLKKEFTKHEEYPFDYAYEHPDSPKLPADSLASGADVDAMFAKEDAALQWLANDWIKANPGSRFVSNADLKSMTEPSTGFSVSVPALRADLKEALDRWGTNTYPPPYFHLAGHYLSLADLFQLLTDALGQLDRTGKLPESVKVVPVYGPVYTVTGHGPNVGDVSFTSITHYCAGLMDTLHDVKAAPIPINTVPNEMKVDDIAMNSAQFLRLMAKALVATSPDEKIRVRMTYMFPGQAQIMPKTRIMGEMGAMWTVKPAPLMSGAAAASK